MKQTFDNQSLEVSIDFTQVGPQKLTYNGDGTLNYVEVTFQGSVYRQTFGYTSGKVTTISAWVKQ